MSENTKRHLKSAGLTFLAGFVLAVAPMLNDMSWEWTGKAALLAFLFTGVRGGLKPLWELALNWATAWFQSRQS